MRAFILNSDEAPAVRLLADRVEGMLRGRGWDVDRLDAASSDISRCLVCGACGERTPGICVLKDDGRRLVAGTAEVDLMVLVTPVYFGGYSPTLKRAFERTMPNIHPEFCLSHGELHHKWRYDKSPSLLTVGHLPEPDPEATAVFAHLAERGAINYLSPAYSSVVIIGDPTADAAEAPLEAALKEVQTGGWVRHPAPDTTALAPPAGRRVLVVGASGRRKSNSRAIAEYFSGRMEACGLEVRRRDIASEGMIDGDLSEILVDIAWAEMVELVSPLYHDTLSYPAMRLLDFLWNHRAAIESRPGFGAFVHSGYPEAVNCHNALAICRRFAGAMQWPWIGGFSAGVTSPIAGRPLAEAGIFSQKLRRGLEDAASRLASGKMPPPPVRPPLPKAFFVLVGNAIVRRGLPRDIDIDARPFVGVGH